ncbi:MAG: hypothetical protein M1835_006637 [Candelina submexicana]|nr:MAG: hypothetical protein M1835_006637 [Candelina submexicana]
MSGSNRFSKDGFQLLKREDSPDMASPNHTTIDIPLTTVTTHGQSGARTADSNLPDARYGQQNGDTSNHGSDEKGGLFHRSAAGRRKVNKDKGKATGRRGADGEEEILTRMGMVYSKILNFSIITRYFLYVLPLAILIAVPVVIGATAAPHAMLGGVRIVWIFTWVEIVWLSLWVSKIFAHYTPAIFQFLCGILMTRNPDQRAAHDTDMKPWASIIQKVLAAALIASLVFLAEKLLIQLISIGYHRKQFNAKIKDSKHNVWLLSLLYDASRALFPAYCNEFAEEDYIINDSINLAAVKKRSHHHDGTATPMKLIRDVGRVGDKVTHAFGNVASEITGKQVFNPNSAHSIVVEALEKNSSSEALAKRLWMSFVVEGRESLYQEDLAEVLGPERRNEAEECFASLDRDGNGDISLDEMILTVVEFGRERHSIANSMHDVDQAINVLDGLLSTIVFVIVVFVFVGFLNANFTTTLATAGTALLSLSFVFASTCQEVLGSCIFLFVKHPYDVGDRIDISTDQLVVAHISLLFTVFKRVSNNKTVQIPNIVLNTNWIENITRSKAMKEQILMYIHFETSIEDIQALKREMQAFVTDKENSRDFQPDIDVEITGIAEMNKLELKVEIKHKSNWANETIRAVRRSKFMCALVLALRKVPIYAPGGGDAALGDVGKPTYSVAITDAEAAANRDAFAAKKEAKRLVPSQKPVNAPAPANDTATSSSNDLFGSPKSKGVSGARADTQSSTTATREQVAADALNARQAGVDPARDDWESYHDDSITPENRNSTDTKRSDDIEEVRGLLHRASTKGKRKPTLQAASGGSNIPAITEVRTPMASPTEEQGRPERRDYAFTAPSQPPPPPPPSDNPYQQRVPQYQPPPNTQQVRPPMQGNPFAGQQQQQWRP